MLSVQGGGRWLTEPLPDNATVSGLYVQERKQHKSRQLPFGEAFADGTKFVVSTTLSVNSGITPMAHVLENQY